MTRCFLLCLVLLNAFMAVAIEKSYKAEACTIRRIGKHQWKVVKSFGSAPVSSPSQAPPHTGGVSPSTTATDDHTAAPTIEANNGENLSVEGQAGAVHLQKHHRSEDKSVAGGGVIFGGLATTFLAAVFCYKRATGRLKSETHQSASEITN